MRKKSLLALLLALTMLLSGCALVAVDQAADNARIIIDVNGETVTKQSVSNSVNSVISQNEYMNQMYSMFGMSASYSTDSATITPQVIEAYVENLVSLQKAKALGLDQFTEEEQAKIKENADSDWASYLSQVAQAYFPDQTLEGEALEAEALKAIEQHGLSGRDTFDQSAADAMLLDKLKEYAIKDVAVTDEEVTALYDEKVAADQEKYTADPVSYGTAVSNGTAVYYAPAGYRNVKHILIQLTDEDSAAVDEKEKASTDAKTALTDAQAALENAEEGADTAALQTAVDEAQKAADEAAAALEAATDAAFANIKGKADEVYALATAEGADFDALVKEYSQDSESAPEYYVVSEGSTVFVAPFVTGAMALEKVGDISEPVRTDYGYHIIKYCGDVAEGPVALEGVREALASEALTAKQESTYADAVAAWTEEADVKTYPEKMK